MGGKSSKQPVKSAPPARGTSRTPPEAWERGSEPDFSKSRDWQNVTNTSYNLLDLQPPPKYKSPASPQKWRSPSPYSRSPSPFKRSPSPYKRSPSPYKRSPSPPMRRKRSPSPYIDKFKHFKNITEKRDSRSPVKSTSSPTKTNRSPIKSLRSPVKSLRSPVKSQRLSKSTFRSLSSSGDPYEKESARQVVKKAVKKASRRNSFNSSMDFKKPSTTLMKKDERRLSDVSTIEASEDLKPSFRTIHNSSNKPSKSNNKPKRTFSVDSLNKISSPYVKNAKRKNKISPPQTGSVKAKINRNYSHGSLGSELSFTNIGVVKSATNSMQSTRSNFDLNERIEKFNDKKMSLVLLDLVKHTVLNNSFRNAKMPGGPQAAYEEAKKQLQKEEWEVKLNGIEKIVTIARNAPDVLRLDLKTCVLLMHEELKNLRSQVCRAAATAWAELFVSLGKGLEPFLDTVVVTLLQKSADTNKFIREGSVEALLAMSEYVTVHKAITSVVDGGINSKSAIVRTQTAFLVDHVINAIGPERFYGSSKETQVVVISNGVKMLADGSLEVRTHAKHMLGLLARHAQFEALVKEVVPEQELRTIKKSLDKL